MRVKCPEQCPGTARLGIRKLAGNRNEGIGGAEIKVDHRHRPGDWLRIRRRHIVTS